jgi:hypothetical protein
MSRPRFHSRWSIEEIRSVKNVLYSQKVNVFTFFMHAPLSQSKRIHTFYTKPDLRDDLLLLELTQCPSSCGVSTALLVIDVTSIL